MAKPITLRPKTKRELKKLLEIHRECEDARDRFIEYKVTASYQSTSYQQPGYGANNVFGRPRPTEEGKQQREQKQDLGQLYNEKSEAYRAQLDVVGKTFVSEYGLNEARATVGSAAPQAHKIYHSTGVYQRSKNGRDIKMICQGLANGDMHPGRFESNVAGIAVYFGNQVFFEEMRDDDNAPDQLIEASISENANVHEISVDDYADCDLKEYQPYFDPEDYKLLCQLEDLGAMHVRSVFDVAMGYDACMRRNPVTESEIWAIYKRGILTLSPSPIINFSDIVPQPADQD